jgi:hypothetical protein
MPDWHARAWHFAAERREPGFTAAGIASAAYSARVDPEATRGLVRCAIILTSGDATAACTAQSDPCPDDWTFLAAVTDLETSLLDLIVASDTMCRDCAKAMAALPADQWAARAVIADCEAAMEELALVRFDLEDAVMAVRQVPADLGEVYEVPYRHLRRGGTLPLHGDFLTGASA